MGKECEMSAAGQETALVPMPSEERVRAIESGRATLLARAEALVVDSAESEQIAWACVNAIGALRKAIEADFGPARKATHMAWKAVVGQEKRHVDALVEPDRIVRGKLSDWETEKRRRQAEAERVAHEKAMAEAKAVAEKQAREAAENARLQAALEAEAAGNAEAAAELLEKPVEVAPVEVAPEAVPVPVVPIAPKVAGAGAMVEVWHFEVLDPLAIPREYLSVNEVAIGKVVQALKGQAKIAGVRVYKTLDARRASRR